MKKLKEFLWFLIPFLCLSVISVVYFILTTEYKVADFTAMLGNPFSIVTIIFSYIPAVILPSIVVIIYKASMHFVFKKRIADNKKYIYFLLISAISTVLYLLIMTRTFDIIDNTIFSLQVGIIVTFIFWSIDLIKDKISKNKTEQK